MSDATILALFYGALFALSVHLVRAPMPRGRGRPAGPGDPAALTDWIADADADRRASLADPPVVHDVPRDAAEFVIPGFRPGIDTCRIALTDPDADFDATTSGGMARLVFLDGGSFLEVCFPGLVSPPLADTLVTGPGGVTRRMTDLAAASARAAGGEARLRRVDADVVEFRAFDTASEMVEIWVPEETPTTPDVMIRPTADGRDGELLIGGRRVARLCGAPDAGARNVRVVRKVSGGAYAEPESMSSAIAGQRLSATS